MGSEHDEFSPLSHPKYEKKFYEMGYLSKEVMRRRKILRKYLNEVGFLTTSNEWWHFDYLRGKKLIETYNKSSLTFSEIGLHPY